MKIMMWGDRKLYDKKLQNKLNKELTKVIELNDEIEFYFVDTGEFSDLCLSIIKRKKKQTKKKLHTIYVSYNLASEYNFSSEQDLYDEIIYPDKFLFYVRGTEIINKTMNRVDIIYCYFYQMFSPADYKKVSKSSKAINLIDEATTRKIKLGSMQSSRLNEKEKDVLQAIGEGKKLKTIAEEWGVSSTSVQNTRNLAIRRLRYEFALIK